MNFYVLPEELGSWLEHIIQNLDHWVLAYQIRPREYSFITDGGDLTKYTNRKINNNIQLFIGKRSLAMPSMMPDGNRRPVLDFRQSLCVKLDPSFIVGEMLLEGSIDTLRPQKYNGIAGQKEFMLWRNGVYRSFKESLSVPSIVVTQVLSDGGKKAWPLILISRGAMEWYSRGGKLKQFAKGPVEFVPEPRSGA